MKNIHKLKNIHHRTKCLNHLCKNDIEEYKLPKQTYQINKQWFCNYCNSHVHYPMQYKCFHKYCNNMITFDSREHLKYCSTTCKQREGHGTAPNHTKYCKQCGQEFTTKLGYRQYFCDTSCTSTFFSKRWRAKYKAELGVTYKRDRHRLRAPKSRSLHPTFENPVWP